MSESEPGQDRRRAGWDWEVEEGGMGLDGRPSMETRMVEMGGKRRPPTGLRRRLGNGHAGNRVMGVL